MLEFKFTTHSSTFPNGTRVAILTPIATRYTLQPVNSVATICDEKDNYRFGFDGQEKVNEVAGLGNHNTAFFWEYDTRLGRRWNLDPRPDPSASNYSTNNNNPIQFTDPKGDIAMFLPVAWGAAEWLTAALFASTAVVTGKYIYDHPVNFDRYPSISYPRDNVILKPILMPASRYKPESITRPVVMPITGEDLKKQQPGFYQVTYLSRNADGKVYIGRTSGYGTPQEIVDKRFAKHHKQQDGFFAGVPTLAISSTEESLKKKDFTYKFIRAAEDIQIKLVPTEISENKRAGISNHNPNKDEYYDTYNKAMRENDNCVNCMSPTGISSSSK